MKRYVIVFMIVICFGLIFSFFSADDYVKDNYYKAINDRVINNNKSNDNGASWSFFSEAQDRVNEDVNLIIEDIISENSDDNVVGSIYSKVIDMDNRNIYGLGELESYLNMVYEIDNVSELVDVIILVENELGVDLLTNVEVVQDYNDNTNNIIYFYPVTYAFGVSSDYIIDDDYMAYKAYIRRACVQLWKEYGYSDVEAREVVERVFNFYEKASLESKLSSDLNDILDYYNVVSEDTVVNLFGSISDDYLYKRGFADREIYSIVDEGQYNYLINSLVSENVSVWKEVIITKILSSYAYYLSSDYVSIVNDLNKAILGEVDDKSKEDVAVDVVKNLFGDKIDKVYEDRYLTSDKVIDINKMFIEIKDVFSNRLINNSWLSRDAKDKALAKLNEMRIIVGIDDSYTYNISSWVKVSNDSLVSDVIKIQGLARDADLERLDSGEVINLIEQTQVNAYYQPLNNSILIPVAFFELVSEYDDYYERLGTLGMIIAHEVTHAFDGNGSKFDEFGNLNDWWSKEDKEVFSELQSEVIDYYSKYEVLDGKFIDGKKTVNENIADLGAVACIIDIANSNKATDDDFKEMFSSLAGIWASYYSDNYMELLLLQDVHAPNEFRVNAVLSSTDKFYQVYNIYPWNNMWIDKEDRVLVW